MTDNHPFTDLTAFQRDMLFVLADQGPSKGLTVKKKLQKVYGKEVNHGRLYPNLDDLVEAGLVSKSERDKRTNEYTLTPNAREALRAYIGWEEECLEEPEETGEADDSGESEFGTSTA